MRPVLRVRRRDLRKPRRPWVVGELTAVWVSAPRWRLGHGQPGGPSIIEGIDAVLLGFLVEELLKLGEFGRVLLGQVVVLAEILVEVVQLPAVVLPMGGCEVLPPGKRVLGACDPAVVVDRPVGEDLEVLALADGSGIGVVEG